MLRDPDGQISTICGVEVAMRKTKPISVSLDKKALARLDALAQADERSRSSMIRKLIRMASVISTGRLPSETPSDPSWLDTQDDSNATVTDAAMPLHAGFEPEQEVLS